MIFISVSLLLKTYIREIVKEALAPKKSVKNTKIEELTEDELTEFSGAGAVGGYSLPLGMNPDDAGRKKNKTK